MQLVVCSSLGSCVRQGIQWVGSILLQMCSITCWMPNVTGLGWTKLGGGDCFWAAGKRLSSGKENRQNEPPE